MEEVIVNDEPVSRGQGFDWFTGTTFQTGVVPIM